MDKQKLVGADQKDYLPIIKDDGASFLRDFCKEHRPKQILEIGTFLGYSASVMLDSCDGHLTTIEIDPSNFENAKINLQNGGYLPRTTMILGDAKDVIESLCNDCKKFDLIFLDGPKGQYIRYLPTLKKLLVRGGTLVADNVFLHGMVTSSQNPIHKHRSMVINLRKFLQAIKEDLSLETQVLDIADGIAVCTLK